MKSSSNKRIFTEQEKDEICRMYQANISINNIIDLHKTHTYRVKQILHERGVRKYPLCKNGCGDIVHSRGVCHRCYFHLIKADHGIKQKKDPLLDDTDNSFKNMYQSGMSIKKIAETLHVQTYTVKQKLSELGILLNDRQCKTNGCHNPVHCKGLCRNCYNREFVKAQKQLSTPKQIKSVIDMRTQELKWKQRRYNACTMAVPIERRVDMRKDIEALTSKINELQSKLERIEK